MPLPSNVGTGTVVGNFSEDAIPGVDLTTWKVALFPSVRQFIDATSTPPSVVFLKPFYEGSLDSSGNLSMTVPANNDADLNPTDFTYRVVYTFPGLELNPLSFHISVPEGGSVNLPTVNPVQQSNGALLVQGVPAGGADGQILAKDSNANYDTVWINPPTGSGSGIPAGGTTGQILIKTSSVDGAATWQTLDPSKITGLSEAIDDRVAALLVAGANVTLTYDDAAGTITVAATGGGGTGLPGGGTSGQALVKTSSVDGAATWQTLDAADVGALPDTYAPDWDDVGSKPPAIAAGATAEIARGNIGAGTSNLAIGTSATTAMAGNKTAAELGGIISDPTGIPGAFELQNFVGIAKVDYDALPDPETDYPDVTFLEV